MNQNYRWSLRTVRTCLFFELWARHRAVVLALDIRCDSRPLLYIICVLPENVTQVGLVWFWIDKSIQPFLIERSQKRSRNREKRKCRTWQSEIINLVQSDFSEPYNIYTYRYFIHNWPQLCFLAREKGKGMFSDHFYF